MSPQGSHGVPRRRSPAVVTVDAGSSSRMSPRFLTLVVDTSHEWEDTDAAEPQQYTVDCERPGNGIVARVGRWRRGVRQSATTGSPTTPEARTSPAA